MPNLASMMGSGAISDPKFLESAMGMMRGMDEQTLASMMMSSGACGNQAQAEAIAKQVGTAREGGNAVEGLNPLRRAKLSHLSSLYLC